MRVAMIGTILVRWVEVEVEVVAEKKGRNALGLFHRMYKAVIL